MWQNSKSKPENVGSNKPSHIIGSLIFGLKEMKEAGNIMIGSMFTKGAVAWSYNELKKYVHKSTYFLIYCLGTE